ncbi:MAG: NfeD family protein [Lentisphaeria bacterium]|nr:NfeD family protein [Lentisphaeria bacterium]
MQWTWIVIGTVMLVAELVIPGFVICFFGAGAILTGLILIMCHGLTITWQVVIFVIASVVFTLCGRRIFLGRESGTAGDIDQDDPTGETAVVAEAIAPNRTGKVEFRGSFWTAEADSELAVGTEVRIVRRDNLVLTVSKK